MLKFGKQFYVSMSDHGKA